MKFPPLFKTLLAIALPLLISAYARADDGIVANQADLIKRGQYLATAGDCIACHSVPAGKPYAGGLEISTPIGRIVSSNITPSKSHGIGNYTLEQFDRALRHGIRADGAPLYPAMPYTAYAQVSDADVQALYAYFMNGVAAVDNPVAPTSLPFPFNIRASMVVWNLLFLEKKPFVPDPGQSVEWNRGAYLVRGLAHCSTCHTPRNIAMAEDNTRALAGASLGGWYAPNISNDPISGIGNWTEGELVAYLQNGRAPGKAQAGGPMAEAIDNSLSRLTSEDLKAIAVYLKTGPGYRDQRDSKPAYSWGEPVLAVTDERGSERVSDTRQFNGAQLYDAYCASCHQARAEGSASWGEHGAALPSLYHNTALGHRQSDNLVMAILEGVNRQSGEVTMPPFKQQLTDQQIVTLSNFLLKNYGNPSALVTLDQVKSLRTHQSVPLLEILVYAGIAIAFLILCALALRRMRRNSSNKRTYVP